MLPEGRHQSSRTKSARVGKNGQCGSGCVEMGHLLGLSSLKAM